MSDLSCVLIVVVVFRHATGLAAHSPSPLCSPSSPTEGESYSFAPKRSFV